ncbi:MAG: hypothetical protein MI865_04750 [Proteobacteria bacterium]|nr:hypothetical protein [Pseudomonadota bacterium]
MNHSGEYLTDHEVFDIPGHGELALKVPKAWNYRYTKTDEDKPPLITFYVKDKSDGEIFQLNMSVLWDDGYQRNVTSSEFIYSLVKQTGEAILSQSDESELILSEIKGAGGKGYLFDLTDSQAGQGEYKYLTQGALSVGEVVLVFSLFSNDEESLLRDAMLKSVKSAQHIFEKNV